MGYFPLCRAVVAERNLQALTVFFLLGLCSTLNTGTYHVPSRHRQTLLLSEKHPGTKILITLETTQPRFHQQQQKRHETITELRSRWAS